MSRLQRIVAVISIIDLFTDDEETRQVLFEIVQVYMTKLIDDLGEDCTDFTLLGICTQVNKMKSYDQVKMEKIFTELKSRISEPVAAVVAAPPSPVAVPIAEPIRSPQSDKEPGEVTPPAAIPIIRKKAQPPPPLELTTSQAMTIAVLTSKATTEALKAVQQTPVKKAKTSSSTPSAQELMNELKKFQTDRNFPQYANVLDSMTKN